MQDAIVGIAFAGTIVGLYFRPFGARDWQVAAVGAVVALAAGPLSLDEAAEKGIDSAGILAFFLGLMLLAAGAEAAGFYHDVARFLGRQRPGRAGVVAVLLLGGGITALLSNDATPLILTPAIFAAARATGKAATGPAFAATFVADGASLLLPFSNPVNLLFYERFDITAGEWLRYVFPAAVAGAAAMGVVTVVAAKDNGEPPARLGRKAVTGPRGLRRFALGVFVCLAVAYVAAAVAGLPLGAISLVAGVMLAVGAVGVARIPPADYRQHVSFGMLAFILALLLLVEAVSAAGLLGWLTEALGWLEDRPALVSIAGAAVLGMVLSNAMNNWPAAVVLAAAIAQSSEADWGVITGTLIGCTIGANLTVVGSLSTVFWLTLARGERAEWTPGEYLRRAALPTLAGVGAACSVAAVVLQAT